ncbi:MAG: LysR family transcriptional regulator [Rhodospirillales bacterium]|nr:LysR family transcriptional regulator [Rhodospirillales bacterium]
MEARQTGPRLRVLLGEAIALGPGKSRLLGEIDKTGSISAAARAMEMSYRRAWLLVAEMNSAFRSPLVISGAGGRQGGGAVVTDFGRRVLAKYLAMEAKATRALSADMAAFEKYLKRPVSG